MNIRADAAPAAIQSVLTDAERHQLLSRANYPHLQEEPGAYLVKITEDMVRSKLLALVANQAFAAGVTAAADVLKKRAEAYHRDQGAKDPSTGAWNYPPLGFDLMCEWEELEESIRELLTSQQQEGSTEC
ncbi:hypothetical protein [Achromobacter xylosoxidans]|uniref:Uncharacterized protein n=1 Tax=Alcaligenes xylosoxydans xylosoxydans TaxID=85698 RepID=A0A1R1JUE3_ALCXX|nr:hypothetical protein [Achromobacter xylosoxidans]OMG87980.1 hypothetical protein BIZ92_10305 [Achromobacter xylosoxidans]